MKYVLYASDSLRPRQKIFEHTVNLCVQMTSYLHILQLINPNKFRQLLTSARAKLEMAHRMFETSMSAATYAQAGSSELARQCLQEGEKGLDDLRRKAEKEGVHAEFSQRIGPPAWELIDFLRKRPDMIMAVLDVKDTLSDQQKESRGPELLQIIPYQMGIPVILPHRNR